MALHCYVKDQHVMLISAKYLLPVVLQQAYHRDKVISIANADAIPLYMHCLRKAARDLQLRGLAVWIKLVHSNMANLSASDRYVKLAH